MALATSLSAIERAAAQGAGRTRPVSGLTDFNGDGFGDLAVGVPFEDVGAVADAGVVHILYGSATGIQATNPDDQVWSQNSPDVADVAEPGDLFGRSLGAGDFNGDGFADVAVGVPLEDVGTVTDAGAVHVLYGSASGLQALAPDDQIWSQDSPDVGGGAEQADTFGSSVSAGDFDGDGFADLAVGVPLEDIRSVVDAGAVQVLYGSAAGLQALAPDDQIWSQDSPDVKGGAETGDQFGSSSGVGDFNNDTFDEIVVGVPYEDLGGGAPIRDAGAVTVLYGTAGGLQAISPDDQQWIQGRGGVQDSPEAIDHFGWSVAAGDFNGDGYADLVVGAPHEDVGSPRVSNAGAANVLYGSPAGLQATAPDDQFWHQDVPGVIGLAESSDALGWSVAAGDFDGDGFADLALGVHWEDGGAESIPRSGAVNILYGSTAGIHAARDWHLEQGDDPVEDAAEKSDEFGHALAIDDFNADGHADLAVGVRYEEIASFADIGAVHMLYGTAAGLQAENPDDRLWTQDSPDVGDRGENRDRFGWSLAGPTTAF